jgi:hypothetical protein
MESGGIYLVLTSFGLPKRYHWGLYYKFSRALGLGSHARHPDSSLSSLDWELEQRTISSIEASLNLVLTLRIGRLRTPDLVAYQTALADKSLINSNDEPEFTCRIWVLRALQKLHESGYIYCRDPNKVGEEATDYAAKAEDVYIGEDAFEVKISKYST